MKPQSVGDQAASNSPLSVGEAGVRVPSGKEADHVTRVKSSGSKKDLQHSERRAHTHFGFLTVDGEGDGGFFECRIKQRGCRFQSMSVGTRNERTEDQNLSRREFLCEQELVVPFQIRLQYVLCSVTAFHLYRSLPLKKLVKASRQIPELLQPAEAPSNS